MTCSRTSPVDGAAVFLQREPCDPAVEDIVVGTHCTAGATADAIALKFKLQPLTLVEHSGDEQPRAEWQSRACTISHRKPWRYLFDRVAPSRTSAILSAVAPTTHRCSAPSLDANPLKPNECVERLDFQPLVAKVAVRHACKDGAVSITVLPSSTVVEVQAALAQKLGRPDIQKKGSLVWRDGVSMIRIPDSQVVGTRSGFILLGVPLQMLASDDEIQPSDIDHDEHVMVSVTYDAKDRRHELQISVPEMASIHEVKEAVAAALESPAIVSTATIASWSGGECAAPKPLHDGARLGQRRRLWLKSFCSNGTSPPWLVARIVSARWKAYAKTLSYAARSAAGKRKMDTRQMLAELASSFEASAFKTAHWVFCKHLEEQPEKTDQRKHRGMAASVQRANFDAAVRKVYAQALPRYGFDNSAAGLQHMQNVSTGFLNDGDIQRLHLRIEHATRIPEVAPEPILYLTRRKALEIQEALVKFYTTPGMQQELLDLHMRLSDHDHTGALWARARDKFSMSLQRRAAVQCGFPDNEETVYMMIDAFCQPEIMFDCDIQSLNAYLRLLEEPHKKDECNIRPSELEHRAGRRWRVVGGAHSGGIVVRTRSEPLSATLPVRLAHGARVEELSLVGDRVHYRRLSGDGPDFGWVTAVTSKGQVLLKPLPRRVQCGDDDDDERVPGGGADIDARSLMPPLPPKLVGSPSRSCRREATHRGGS